MTNFDSSFDHLNTPSFLFPSRNGQDVDIDYIDSPRGSNFKKYNEVFDSKWEAIEDIASKSNNLGKTPYKSKKNSENVEDMLNSSFQKLFQSVVNFLPPLKPEDLQNQTEQLGDPQTRATPSPEPINRPNMLNESSEIQNDFESQIYQLRSKIKDLEREKNELAEKAQQFESRSGTIYDSIDGRDPLAVSTPYQKERKQEQIQKQEVSHSIPQISIEQQTEMKENSAHLMQLLQSHLVHLRNLWQHEFVSAAVLREKFLELQQEFYLKLQEEEQTKYELEYSKVKLEQSREVENQLRKELEDAKSEIRDLKDLLKTQQDLWKSKVEQESQIVKQNLNMKMFSIMEEKDSIIKEKELLQRKLRTLMEQVDLLRRDKMTLEEQLNVTLSELEQKAEMDVQAAQEVNVLVQRNEQIQKELEKTLRESQTLDPKKLTKEIKQFQMLESHYKEALSAQKEELDLQRKQSGIQAEKLRNEKDHLSNLVHNSAIQLAVLKDRALQERDQFLGLLENKENELRNLWIKVLKLEEIRKSLLIQKGILLQLLPRSAVYAVIIANRIWSFRFQNET